MDRELVLRAARGYVYTSDVPKELRMRLYKGISRIIDKKEIDDADAKVLSVTCGIINDLAITNQTKTYVINGLLEIIRSKNV